ncbi:MAG: M24 family metallopeptidase, partial [Planctomycetota bacterium]
VASVAAANVSQSERLDKLAEALEKREEALRERAAAVQAKAREAAAVEEHEARVLADGLVQMGLMKGDPDQLVEAGAHAVFFPHGVGHLIGIDVHDMEGFGDRVHYPGGRRRSDQFGTCFLRMDRDLETGHVFTIEPGIYFVPAILHEPELRAKFGSMIDYAAAERFLALNDGRGFGGIRIEDDVLCTGDGSRVLTEAVPKTREAVEATVGTA